MLHKVCRQERLVPDWNLKLEELEQQSRNLGAGAAQPGASIPLNSQQPQEDALVQAGQTRSPGTESQLAIYVSDEQAQTAQPTQAKLQEAA